MIYSPYVAGTLARQLARIEPRRPAAEATRGVHVADEVWARIANHEGAHAATSLALGSTAEEIAIYRDDGGCAAGHFRALACSDRVSALPKESEKQARVALCAGLREDTARNSDTGGWAYRKIAVTVAGLAWDLGCNDPSAHDHSRDDIEAAKIIAGAITTSSEQRDRLLDQSLFLAAAVVDRNRSAILSLGRELVRVRRMDGSAIRQVLDSSGFPVPSAPTEWPATIACYRWRGAALSGATGSYRTRGTFPIVAGQPLVIGASSSFR